MAIGRLRGRSLYSWEENDEGFGEEPAALWHANTDGWVFGTVQGRLSQQPHFVTDCFTKHCRYEHSLFNNLSLLHISSLLFASVSSSVNGVTFLSLAR